MVLWPDGVDHLDGTSAERKGGDFTPTPASTQQRCQVGGVVLEGAAQRKTPSSQVWVCGRQFQTSAACLAFGSLEQYARLHATPQGEAPFLILPPKDPSLHNPQPVSASTTGLDPHG
jgi:hypothetical protein